MLHFQESTFLLEQKVDYFYWIGVVMAKVDDNFVCTLILANFFDLRCISIFAVCRHFVCVCVCLFLFLEFRTNPSCDVLFQFFN